MNNTQITWTEKTWNPVSGCTPRSEGCKHCYARRIAETKRGTIAFPRGFDIMMRPWKLKEPQTTKRPSLIFTSMTDLFHERIPDSYRDDIISAMWEAPWHRYQVLTKRPENAAHYFSTRSVPDIMWLGVSIELQRHVKRVDVLRSIKAPLRFLSCEPLLGPLDLRGRLDGISWVIGGGESGPHLSSQRIRYERGLIRRGSGRVRWEPRPDRIDWARGLRDACAEAGVHFWWKQWGGPTPKSAGKLLDGKVHESRPSWEPSKLLPQKAMAV